MDKCAPILEGGLFTRKEADAFRQRMNEWTPEEWASNRDFIESQIRGSLEDGIDAKKRQIQDMMNVKDIVQQITHDPISGNRITNISDALKNRLDGLVGRNSVDTRRRAARQHLKGMIDETNRIFDTQSNQTYKTLNDIPKGSDVERQLYKRVYSYEKSIDISTLTPEAAQALIKNEDEIGKLAMSIVAYNEYARKFMGRYGVSTKFSKNYVMKRRYDWDAVSKLGPEKFADFMSNKLDLEQTFGKGTTKESAIPKLLDVYNEFAVDATERTSVTSNKEFSSQKGNSIARKFFYKDADAAYDAFNELSLGGMREQFDRNAGSMAVNAVSVSEFGYNPAEVMGQVERELAQIYKDQKPGIVDKWRGERIKQAELELSGQQNLVSGAVTNFANNTRFMMAFAKLGNAVTGTILDVVDNGRQVFYVNGNVFGGFADFGVAMTKVTAGMNQAERLELAQQLGIALNHISMSESMRLADGSIGSNGGRLTQWIQEHGTKAMNIATLLPAQTSRSKIASGMVGAQTFSKLMDKYASGASLNKFELDTFKEYGFNEFELKTLASGMIERSNNWVTNPIYTAQGIRQSLLKGSDEAHIKKVAGMLGVAPEKAGQAVLELAGKYDNFLNDFVVRGTPTPELATKTAMFKGVNNEIIRAGIGLMTQFLDTPVAQLGHMTELYSKLERINDSRIGMLKDALPHAATYLGVALPAYFAADYAMSIATNRESMVDKIRNGDDEQRRKIMTNAIGRSGLVPFLFEVVDSQWGGGYNKTALDTFGSPAMSTLRDVLKLTQTEEQGGLSFQEFALRQGPTNSLPLRAINQWSETAIGEKLWQTKQNTFFQ